jgi:hypothetical protein
MGKREGRRRKEGVKAGKDMRGREGEREGWRFY